MSHDISKRRYLLLKDGGRLQKYVYAYHGPSRKWLEGETGGDIPPNHDGSTAIIRGKDLWLFMWYGYSAASLHKLSLTSLLWSRVNPTNPMPSPRGALTAWLHRDRLYFFGGYGYSRPIPHTYPYPNGSFATHLDHEVFVVASKEMAEVEDGVIYQQVGCLNNQLMVFDPESQKWSNPVCPGHVPSPRYDHAACLATPDLVVLFGGKGNRDQGLDDLYSLDLTTLVESEHEISPPERKRELRLVGGRSLSSLCVMRPGWVLLYGGEPQEGRALGDAWALSLATWTWLRLPIDETFSRFWHTANLLGTTLVINGGANIYDEGSASNLLEPCAGRVVKSLGEASREAVVSAVRNGVVEAGSVLSLLPPSLRRTFELCFYNLAPQSRTFVFPAKDLPRFG